MILSPKTPNPVQQIVNAYFHRAMQEALAKYGQPGPSGKTRIVATVDELRDVFADVCAMGVYFVPEPVE